MFIFVAWDSHMVGQEDDLLARLESWPLCLCVIWFREKKPNLFLLLFLLSFRCLLLFPDLLRLTDLALLTLLQAVSGIFPSSCSFLFYSSHSREVLGHTGWIEIFDRSITNVVTRQGICHSWILAYWVVSDLGPGLPTKTFFLGLGQQGNALGGREDRAEDCNRVVDQKCLRTVFRSQTMRETHLRA